MTNALGLPGDIANVPSLPFPPSTQACQVYFLDRAAFRPFCPHAPIPAPQHLSLGFLVIAPFSIHSPYNSENDISRRDAITAVSHLKSYTILDPALSLPGLRQCPPSPHSEAPVTPPFLSCLEGILVPLISGLLPIILQLSESSTTSNFSCSSLFITSSGKPSFAR